MYHGDDELWRKTRPIVLDAYAQQFKKDFLLFLECRAQEMVPGGRLVVCLAGTQSPASGDGPAQQIWEAVARILDDMASRV
jgi:jasmonate O-methyltransferase